MKKIFTLCASALFILGATAAAPASGLIFNGSTFIDLGDSTVTDTQLSNPTSLTVEVWVNYASKPSGCSNYIISNESGSNGGWVLRHETGIELSIGAPKADGSGSDWFKASSGNSPEPNEWHHLAGVYDGSALTIKLYIDGVEAATKDLVGVITASDQTLTIGDGKPWPGRFFNGTLSDLRVWSVAKTESEVFADMTNSLTGTESGLIANWKMNECQGEQVNDATGIYTFDIVDTEAITWFGEAPNRIKNIASANVDAKAYGNSLTIANNGSSTLNYAIYNVAGIKTFEGTAKAGASISQKVNLKGVYFVKGVTVNGETFNQKVIF